MLILLKKFGDVLTSRQAGREAYSAFLPSLATVKADELVTVNFEGVISFTPSWGDEFLTPLLNKFTTRLQLVNTDNPSVRLTLETLEEVNLQKFLR